MNILYIANVMCADCRVCYIVCGRNQPSPHHLYSFQKRPFCVLYKKKMKVDQITSCSSFQTKQKMTKEGKILRMTQ